MTSHRPLSREELAQASTWLPKVTKREEEVIRLVHRLDDNRGPMSLSDAGRTLAISQQAASQYYRSGVERVRGERPPARRVHSRAKPKTLAERVVAQELTLSERHRYIRRAKDLPTREWMVASALFDPQRDRTVAEAASTLGADEAVVLRLLESACRSLETGSRGLERTLTGEGAGRLQK